MSFPSNIREKIQQVVDRYGILLAGILIFAYYLWTAIDMFTGPNKHPGFQGYVFRFDSVIILWLLLFVSVKLYEYKKKQRMETENNRKLLFEYEWQKRQLEMLDEVTTVVSDSINNPLAIISVSAGSIREKFSADSEILSFLDHIDGALKRMNEVLHGFQAYQTKKILNSTPNISSQSPEESGIPQATRKQSKPSVSPTGEIHNS